MGDGDGGSPRRHRTRRAVGLKDSGSAASPLAREPADDSIGSAPNGSTGHVGARGGWASSGKTSVGGARRREMSLGCDTRGTSHLAGMYVRKRSAW
jgi:hypothetical protein